MSGAMTADQSAAAGRVTIDLSPGEGLTFAGLGILVELVARSGRAARLRITAPKSVAITRADCGDVCAKHANINGAGCG